jgi:G3E family GTPase
LENNQSIKIGTIVNDVASVNIDAKLVSNTDSWNESKNKGGVIELQNGCACCSLAYELMESVMQLTSGDGADGSRRELDAIVVELSGVSDPVAVRDNWEVARLVSLYFWLHTNFHS